MILKCISTIAEFTELKDDWNRLDSNPLKSFSWNFQWWTQYRGKKDSLRVYSFYSHNELVGIAPFFVDRWLGQKRLRFLGTSSACTDYASVIVRPEFRHEFHQSIASDIWSRKDISIIEFEGVIREDDQHLRKLLNANSFWQYEIDIEPSWCLSLPNCWSKFVKAGSKSLQRKIRKSEKRLESKEFDVRSTADSLRFDEAFTCLIKLHQDRFTQKGECGVFSDSRFEKFLENSAKELISQGKAEILVGYYDESPIAAQIYLNHESGPQFYQSGIRTDAMKLEPGHLLFTYSIRKAIHEGHSTFDFLRGNESYKAFWGAEPRRLSKIRCVSSRTFPSALNRSIQILRFAKRSFRFGRSN